MNTCAGNGECLEQCECLCYNEETDTKDEICKCDHREHNSDYCSSDCCVPVKCLNENCGVTQPQWVSDCNNGMCMNCAVEIYSKDSCKCSKDSCPSDCCKSDCKCLPVKSQSCENCECGCKNKQDSLSK